MSWSDSQFQEGRSIITTVLGELVKAQDAALGILSEARQEDRSFAQALVGSSEYPDAITADVAVIFSSLFKREELSEVDVHMAVDFQDYLDSLGYEIRRKPRNR